MNSLRYKIKRDILKKMKSIYYQKGDLYLDWMGYLITQENYPTYHHIKKACELRSNQEDDIPTLENGAYLGKNSHEILHVIERKDKDLYEAWNYLFLIINKMHIYPIDDVWKMTENLRQETEKVLKR